MDIKLSLIETLEQNKIMFDGSAYIIEDIEKEELTSSLLKYSFDNVINNIVNAYDQEETYKSSGEIHNAINEYLKIKEDVKKTIILLPDNGLRGIDKVNLTLNSILYFKIAENFGLGFLVNKTLASFLSKNLNYIERG